MSGFIRRALNLFRASKLAENEDLPTGDLKAGGLYSVYNGAESGDFGVVKILVLEPNIVHIRVYQNSFATRPESIDPASLSLGSINLDNVTDDEIDMMKFGIGHMPLALRDFIYGWQPVRVGESAVTEEELEGYKIWKEDGGGVFGGLA